MTPDPNPSRQTLHPCDQAGFALISLIIILVVLGILGTLMVSLSDNALKTNITTVSDTRARNIAQSGYRYFASRFRSANVNNSATDVNDTMRELNGTTFFMDGDTATFSFNIETYYYTVLQPPGSMASLLKISNGTIVSLALAGAFPPSRSIPQTGVMAALSDGGGYNFFDYSITRPLDIQMHFAVSVSRVYTGAFLTQAGMQVFQAAPIDKALTPNTLTFNEDHSADLVVNNLNGYLPPQNGMFFFQNDTGDRSKVYVYNTRTEDGPTGTTKLMDIRWIHDPSYFFTYTPSAGEKIIIHSFARINVTGTALPGSTMGSQNTFTRSAALGTSQGGFANKVQPYTPPPYNTKNLEKIWDFDKNVVRIENNDKKSGISAYGGDPNTVLFFHKDNGNKKSEDLITDGQGALIFLKWHDNPDPLSSMPDLVQAWSNNQQRLSYDLQIKFKLAKDENPLKFEHYMMGLCFRLDVKKGNTYGLSLFRHKQVHKGENPDWLDHFSQQDLEKISDEKGTPQLILWKCSGSGGEDYKLLRHVSLLADECTDDLVKCSNDENYLLTDWSTLVLHLEERYTSDDWNSRTNVISAYVRTPEQSGKLFEYLPGSPVHWFFPEFCKADWSPCEDATFTTKDFSQKVPEEIGIHCFDDVNAPHTTFFTDFSIRLVNPGKKADGSCEF
ncbi:MAG: hypothetical protein V1793_09345 [Pseudomonadota bacterium]